MKELTKLTLFNSQEAVIWLGLGVSTNWDKLTGEKMGK
jgi:hypothetical protein